MKYDVFISYSRKDSDVANRIVEALEAAGISCFIDWSGIGGGADFPEILSSAILDSRLFLLVGSEQAYQSEFTIKEVTFALNRKGSQFIFPLIVDRQPLPTHLEFLLSNINWRELTSRYRIEKELVADIKRKLDNPHAGETLQQKERRSVRTLIWSILAFIGLAVAGGTIGYYVHNNNLKQKAQRVAVDSQEQMDIALSLVERTSQLQKSQDPLGTWKEEITSLDSAGRLVSLADSSIKLYKGSEYSRFFDHLDPSSLESLQKKIDTKKDSMARVWLNDAQSSFKSYQSKWAEDSDPFLKKTYCSRALRYNEAAQYFFQDNEDLRQQNAFLLEQLSLL